MRYYCWQAGTGMEAESNGDCPECGHHGRTSHRVIPDDQCGSYTACVCGKGHLCELRPDHKGECACPDAKASHAADRLLDGILPAAFDRSGMDIEWKKALLAAEAADGLYGAYALIKAKTGPGVLPGERFEFKR